MLTKEHMVSKWAKRFVPAFHGTAHELSATYADSPFDNFMRHDLGNGQLASTGDHRGKGPHALCPACNSKFGSQLEVSARPYLEHVFTKIPFSLDLAGQTAVSRWTFLKAAVAESTVTSQGGISVDMRRFFHQTGDVPNQTYIFLRPLMVDKMSVARGAFRIRSGYLLDAFEPARVGEPPTLHWQATLFSCGDVAFLVTAINEPVRHEIYSPPILQWARENEWQCIAPTQVRVTNELDLTLVYPIDEQQFFRTIDDLHLAIGAEQRRIRLD